MADHRSFSKAAIDHRLTQSAVSQAMHQLEESLGVQLIDRTKRPLVLTKAGGAYYKGLRGIVRDYRRLEQEVRGVSEQLRGRVTVGAIYSVGLSYMPEATAEFATMHPEVEVRTEFGHSQRVVEMTLDGQVDFGLVSFPRSTKQLKYVLWQQEPMRLICSDKHKLASRVEISLSELQGMEMIGFDRNLVLRTEIDQCLAKAGVTVDVRMEFDNADSMVRAIQANRGIGIVPEASVRRETANGSLKVVACREFRMVRPLGIIFRRSGALSRAADEFGSLLLGRPLGAEKKSKSGSVGAGVDGTPRSTKNGVSVVA